MCLKIRKPVFKQIEYIQMQQNTFKKEIVLIEAQIDSSMQRIAQLLQLIAKQQKPVHLHTKQSLANSDDQLNQTYYQTDYNTTATDMFYHFMPIDQQILLDGYSDNMFTQQIRINLPKQMIVPTKANWISSFLDCKDANVMFNHQDGLIKLLNVQKGHFNCLNPQKGLLTISSSQVYAKENLTVQFPAHLRCFQLNLQVQAQKMLYQFTIQQKSRILFECQNNDSHLIRFLIIKEEDEDYSIIWGSYSQQAIFQSLILQAGAYIILPLSANLDLCNIYCQETTLITINKQTQRPFKTYNLLKRLFEECQQSLGLKRSQSLLSDTQDTKKQYIRSCYMNYGIIVEIYYNIFEEECRFIDECHQREDKQLLLQAIYTESQMSNILCPGQQLIKFYVINKKPANLFVPHKKVFLGNKAVQNVTYHNVFK